MTKQTLKTLLAVGILILAFVAAGCGGGSGLHRATGLSADGVVRTFFDAAKAGRLDEAALYVSPTTVSDPTVMVKYFTGQSGLDSLKNANLLSLKKVAEQGNYAAVVATLQPQQGSLNVVVKPVGLEKIDGEWYIVDFSKIYSDAKYAILQQLLSRI